MYLYNGADCHKFEKRECIKEKELKKKKILMGLEGKDD